MKFVATEEIAAPIDVVWARVSDFEAFERRAAGKAGQVSRSPEGPAKAGTKWTGSVEAAGKVRQASVTLLELDAPHRMDLEGGSDGMTVTLDVMLEALSPTKTRLTVTTEAKARSLAARLMLQSAKLARPQLAKRYKGRVAGFADKIEKSYATS
ncbi:SRPBCC family protein [Jannaschia sp. 2305UL9-9]|uniref:SRPBCC family protein n=1 Tax=Jannaschia sp. 2305UL9-9 TaxID=3121638 RepID=UPI0035286C61